VHLGRFWPLASSPARIQGPVDSAFSPQLKNRGGRGSRRGVVAPTGGIRQASEVHRAQPSMEVAVRVEGNSDGRPDQWSPAEPMGWGRVRYSGGAWGGEEGVSPSLEVAISGETSLVAGKQSSGGVL
jgi:hypothetical protein